jgi:hypothetical protein
MVAVTMSVIALVEIPMPISVTMLSQVDVRPLFLLPRRSITRVRVGRRPQHEEGNQQQRD